MLKSILFFLTVSLSLVCHVSSQDATVFYSIREELAVNSYVGSVPLESGLFANISNEKFSRLQFQISKELTNAATFFKIEADTGLLFVDKVIDREKFDDCYLDCILEFNVVVYDLDTSDLTKFINVQIDIKDYNDNAPEFVHVQNPIQILETIDIGSVIVSGLAIDIDRGEDNSVQTYELLPETDMFDLTITENMEYEIRVAKQLDREVESFYQIVVLAKDGGDVQLTGTVTINIEVIDDNDNYPIFSEDVYDISIHENVAKDTNILKLSAVDMDEGVNGKVLYKFSHRASKKIHDLFRVNSTSGELSVSGNIDFETDKEFNFQVIAYDHGDPAKSSTASVIIKVLDVNDNSPIINLNQPLDGASLSEYAEIGTFVAHVEIIDLDSGKNGKVVCNILDNNFKLETMGIADNYKVVLNETLDHDKKPFHNVTILCQDLGNLPRQTFANFIVNVYDENDNAPIFTANLYTVSIVENNDKGVSILKISANDKDSGVNGEITYSLYVEPSGLFVIDSLTGIITANTSLDREELGDKNIFSIYARDKGNPALTSTGTVVVNILDLNDNDPIYTSDPIRLNVLENQSSGTVVGKVSVSDPDAGLNGTFHLKFPDDPNILEYFQFDESGVITTKQELDRERKDHHKFYVKAADMGGRTSSALIIVSVKDVNDNAPDIIYPNEYDNILNIAYTFEENSEVIEIIARDYDTGENSTLFFFIDSNNASYRFNLDTRSGIIFLNKSLYEKDVGDTYFFNVRVKDGGNPSLESTVNFYISVTEGEKTGAIVSAEGQFNLWIVIGIIIFTSVTSIIIIIVIVKICWCNRRGISGGKTGIIIGSKDMDPSLMDSSSSGSTSSKDSNGNEKIKDGSLQIKDGYDKGYYSNLDETGYLTNSSMTSMDNQMYIDQVKQFGFELEKKIDETNSDNSGEIGTRDSGQGGSDVDLSDLTELPALDMPDGTMNSPQTSRHNKYDGNFHRNNIYNSQSSSFSDHGFHDNLSNMSENSFLQKSTASFSNNPTKTAERKEITKLRKSQKRVMFSDDLENSHSSSRSDYSATDVGHAEGSPVRSRPFQRMLSEDLTDSSSQLRRANDWYRRSADNFARRPNNDKIYNQLPSNQIRSGTDFRNRPMGSNVKMYLDKVLQKTKSSTSTDGLSSPTESDNVFSIDTLNSESSYRDNDTTATSGTYDLLNGDIRLNLASSSVSQDRYANDIDI